MTWKRFYDTLCTMAHLPASESSSLSFVPLIRPHQSFYARPHYHPEFGLLFLTAYPTVVDHGAGPQIAWDTRRSALLCLGRLYNLEPGAFRMTASHPELVPLLHQRLIARRSWYVRALGLLLADAVGSFAQTLRFEHAAWFDRDLQHIKDRLAPKLTGWPDPGSHWLWQGRLGYTRPAMDWDGVQDVSLYRLLWTHYRPHELLTDQDRPRKVAWCPDKDDLRRCVNPFHFEYAIPLKLQRATRSRPGVRDDLTPPFKPIWHAGRDARDDARGNRRIMCPNNPEHGPLGPKTQHQAFVEGLPRGRGYCAECYKLWVQWHPRTAVREYAGRTEQIHSRAQLEERSKVQLKANADARTLDEKVQAAQRAIEAAFPQVDPDNLFPEVFQQT